jgi:hypothetical protein
MRTCVVPVLALVMLTPAGCGEAGGAPIASPEAAETSATAGPTPAGSGGTGRPLPGWQIHISSFAKFAVWHPAGWDVTEHHHQNRSVELTLTPAAGKGGVVIRRRLSTPPARTDPTSTHCVPIRISQLPGVRCTDTTNGTVTASLTGTGQGDFAFQTSSGQPGSAEFDTIIASFQLLRGA